MENLREALLKPLKPFEGYYQDLQGYLFQPSDIENLRKNREFTSCTPRWHQSGMNSPAFWGTIMANGKSPTDYEAPPSLETFWERQKQAYDNRDLTHPQYYMKAIEGKNYPSHLAWAAVQWQKKRPQDSQHPPIDISQAITEVFIRTTLQSWEGYLGEMLSLKYWESLTPQLSNFTGEEVIIEEPPLQWDFDYNCDLLIRTKSGRLLAGIQVKPRSYVIPSKTSSRAKQINAFKDDKFKREQGAEIWYFEKESAIYGEPPRLIYGDSIHSESRILKTLSLDGDTFVRAEEPIRR